MPLESLLNICIKYVSLNMNLVESLVGFPDVIGKQIFEECIYNGQLEDDSPATKYAIALFGEAYGGEFMDSLECHSLQIVSEFGEGLVGLSMYVTHLNLSDCFLGNGSEFLRVFMDFPYLEILNISGNELDVEGFKLMFTRYKVFKTGFENLQVLDISRNKLNVNILKTIVTLPGLRKLKVSITEEMKNDSKYNIQEWTQSLKKARFEIFAGTNEDKNVVFNSGWGNQILNYWHNKIVVLQERKKESSKKMFYNLQPKNSEMNESDLPIENAKNSQKFYSKTLKMLELSKNKRTQNCSRYNTYVYIKNSPKNNDSFNDIRDVKVQSRKRKMDFENSSNKKYTKIAQTVDMELLKMYMKK